MALESLRRFLDNLIPKEKAKHHVSFHVTEPALPVITTEGVETSKIDIRYPLIEPFAYAHIHWSKEDRSLIYEVDEPMLTKNEKEKYDRILGTIMKLLDSNLSTMKTREEISKYLEAKVSQALDELGMDLAGNEEARIMYYLYRNFSGLNELEPLMHDSYIEDVGVDGVNVPVYIVHKKFGSMKTNVIFKEEDRLREFVIKLSERCGRFISYAEPLFDGTLPDGTRVQATLSSDVTTRGSTISIRKFSKEPISPVQLIKYGTASAELMAYLWFCVENGSSILICGGVASGKTTLLNAISLFIQPEYKIVTIEDTRELNLPHDNWIPAVARVGFGPPTEGKRYGDITMFDLLKASFRQNPDYVIVGEIRGAEAHVMFQGMASGNPSMGTMHADGILAAVKRLMSPPIGLAPNSVESLDIVITMSHVKEKGPSSRRVKLIEEIQRIEGDDVYAAEIFSWSPSSDAFEYKGSELVISKISRMKGFEMFKVREDIKDREKVLKWMSSNGIENWKDVAKVLSEYMKDKANLMKRVEV